MDFSMASHAIIALWKWYKISNRAIDYEIWNEKKKEKEEKKNWEANCIDFDISIDGSADLCKKWSRECRWM